MQPKYSRLLPQVEEQILSDRAAHAVSPWRCDDSAAVRREMTRDLATLLRPAFVRDIEKILNNPYYNRYNDKTQVFSFYKNDDISRRGLHVQLVSRIARDIGGLLGLNTDLIEAIALGHDIGHTPFGHAGERFLSEIYFSRTGRYFNHNVHSARVLDKITPWNVSLQVLDGVLCHNGEFEQHEYRPQPAKTFADFDREMEACYQEQANIRRLVPMTLEGCVVRISDMIAYVGKDRQDAVRARLKTDYSGFSDLSIGTQNAQMINNIVVDIVNNSYNKPYLLLSPEIFADLRTAKRENYEQIYFNPAVEQVYNDSIRPMMHQVYERLLQDLKDGRKSSPIYGYFDYLRENHMGISFSESEPPDNVVTDFIASMTDDYFVDIYRLFFPKGRYDIHYHSYFD